MARIPRIKLAETVAFYHCYARVAGPVGSFPLDHWAAHRKLVQLIRYYVRGYCCQLAAFCVMGNHYHLVLKFEAFHRLTAEDLQIKAHHFYPQIEKVEHWTAAHWQRFNHRLFDVSELMRNIQMGFAKWYNRRFHRRGAFWEGRFKSTLLADLTAVQECLLYVDLNPVRAGLVQQPEHWKRSSAYFRDLGQDGWLMNLRDVFPQVLSEKAFEEYRGSLMDRGALSSAAATETSASTGEQRRAWQQHGLYRKRLRYFTDGLVLGGESCVRDWIVRLERQGCYWRRRHPIFQTNTFLTALRKQRTLPSTV